MGLRALALRAVNRLIAPTGFLIRRLDAPSYPLSDRMKQEIARQLVQFLAVVPPLFPSENWQASLDKNISDFMETWGRVPIHDPEGGCGFNAALVLFLAARTVNPQLIVESGTFRGGSSWIFRQACPDADLHCFDLTFELLLYRDKSIHYHEHDWSQWPLGFKVPERNLCYFDDHVSQGQRLLEAAERGFTRAIFDDNVPWHALHKDGLPPVPTIDMLLDTSLKDAETLEWVSAGRRLSYVHNDASTGRARSVIARVERSPRLQQMTGYFPETDKAFVCIKPDRALTADCTSAETE